MRLVEINHACDDARARQLKTLTPVLRRSFATRYDDLVAQGLAANPEPPSGRKRDALARQSYNLATAFATHKKPILAFMNNLPVGMTNNQAERDLRPVKLHRKISSCFKGQAGAERFAHVRSYLSTTRKNDIPALEALTTSSTATHGCHQLLTPLDHLNGYTESGVSLHDRVRDYYPSGYGVYESSK